MKTSPLSSGISRRRFIAVAGAAIAAPTIIPASALGRDQRVSPSERIVVAGIGMGWQGGGNLGGFLGHNNCQVVAVCDVDKNHLQSAADTVNKKYQNQDCKT
ncbi:MAG TPA: hypothetical protein VN625_03440 [Desulfuromonadaceae bacterium]|nr:hypothetical protein [Desulfuromonadaceae bacterium]